MGLSERMVRSSQAFLGWAPANEVSRTRWIEVFFGSAFTGPTLARPVRTLSYAALTPGSLFTKSASKAAFLPIGVLPIAFHWRGWPYNTFGRSRRSGRPQRLECPKWGQQLPIVHSLRTTALPSHADVAMGES